MKTIGVIVLIVVGVILAFIYLDATTKANESEIRNWAKEKSLEVKTIDMHITVFGTPFCYLNKGCFIYEVDMTNGEKWWVRTNIFGNDYEKEK